MEHQRPRYTALHPEGSYNETKNIVDRLLMDSTADEVFVLQSIRDKVDPETLAEVQRALDNIAARSRHIGQHLVELSKPLRPVTPQQSARVEKGAGVQKPAPNRLAINGGCLLAPVAAFWRRWLPFGAWWRGGWWVVHSGRS
jgi:hypothetical protein